MRDLDKTPLSAEIQVELTSPSKTLKVLKVGASGSLLKPQSSSDYLQLEGSAAIYADDDGVSI